MYYFNNSITIMKLSAEFLKDPMLFPKQVLKTDVPQGQSILIFNSFLPRQRPGMFHQLRLKTLR